MEKKTRLITLKTFEEFKSDNANHYGDVLEFFKQMLQFLNTNGVKRDATAFGMVDAGDWKIEGSIYVTELQSEDDTLDTDIIFHNDNDTDSIMVNVTGYGETTHDSKGDYDSAPEFDSESHLTVESIVLWMDDGSSDYSIAVSEEIENIVINIINKIAK